MELADMLDLESSVERRRGFDTPHLYSKLCSVGQVVKTSPFHGEIEGSIPSRNVIGSN